jgi:hypothetical protein
MSRFRSADATTAANGSTGCQRAPDRRTSATSADATNQANGPEFRPDLDRAA